MSINSADKAYAPRGSSVAGRVVEFFVANPEEELTSTDIVEKFACPITNLPTQLAPAVRAGLLAKVGGAGGAPNTYRAGPRVLSGEHPERQPVTEPQATAKTTDAPGEQEGALPVELAEPAQEGQQPNHVGAESARPAIVIHVHVHIDGRPQP